jgi:hypothetical protein
VALGSQYDDKILKLLALTPMSATRLGREQNADDGALTLHLFNNLVKDGLVEIVDAAGPNPVWGLTQKGDERRRQLGSP